MSRLVAAALLLAASIAAPISDARAQPGAVKRGAAAPAGARDPGDPGIAVPAARYSSAFRAYRLNAEVELGAWRGVNDTVGRIGGWRTYGREAISAEADGAAANAAPAGAAPANAAPAGATRAPDVRAAPAPARSAHEHKH